MERPPKMVRTERGESIIQIPLNVNYKVELVVIPKYENRGIS